MKFLTVSIFLFSMTILFSELIMGYARYQQLSSYSLAMIDLYSSFKKLIVNEKENDKSKLNIELENIPNDNPFKNYRASIASIPMKYHPFIDYSGAYKKKNQVPTDYFGFRNKENLYFKNRCNLLVVMTGGSEAAGWSHEVSISENLYILLQNKYKSQKICVLNLSMNSYVVANEINAFVNLAYNLKPDIVISHTGYNDLHYAPMVPLGFKIKGLNYPGQLLDWMPRLYNLKSLPVFDHKVKPKNIDKIVPTLLQNILKYKNVVESSGAKFILGAQAHKITKDMRHPLIPYEIIYTLLEEFDYRVSNYDWIINFISKSNEFTFVDTVHSNEEDSKKISRVYFNKITDIIEENKDNFFKKLP